MEQNGNSIVSLKNYGKVHVKLSKLMDARGITRGALSSMTATRFEVIDRWYTDHLEKMDLDVLARVCYALDCQAQDIIEYVKDDVSE